MTERVYHIVDGKMVPKPGNSREPGRRYRAIANDPRDSERIVCELTPEEEAARDEEEARWEVKRPVREAHAREQTRKADEFRASLKYEFRLVAFLDVLGWRKAIEKSTEDSELVRTLGVGLTAMQGQISLATWMHEHGGETNWPGDPQATQFSDCIVISARPDSGGKAHLISSMLHLCTVLLWNGFLVRGAVTNGQLYHRNGIVYGPALTRAYDLERDEKFPRIVLDKEIARSWGSGEKISYENGDLLGYFKTWRSLPNDERVFLDFLQPFNTTTFQTPTTNFVRQSLEPARKLIENGLSEHFGDAKIREKYLWFREYYNVVAAEYPHAGIEPIRTGGDGARNP